MQLITKYTDLDCFIKIILLLMCCYLHALANFDKPSCIKINSSESSYSSFDEDKFIELIFLRGGGEYFPFSLFLERE